MNGNIGTFVDITKVVQELRMKPREFIRHWMDHGLTREEAKDSLNRLKDQKVFQSEHYMVHVEPGHGPGNEWIHLSIRSYDGEANHDWRDLQAIKNTLVGEENEALEVYPAESRLIDECNQFHLFVSSDPNRTIPFGYFRGREVSMMPTVPGTFQRGEDGIERKKDGIKDCDHTPLYSHCGCDTCSDRRAKEKQQNALNS